MEEDRGDEYLPDDEENNDNYDIAGIESEMEVLEEDNFEPAPVYNNEVVAAPRPYHRQVLDGGEDTIVAPPKIMDAERAQYVAPTHNVINNIVRRERVRNVSPPVSERVRSAQGSPVLRRYRRIRNPLIPIGTYMKTDFRLLLLMMHYSLQLYTSREKEIYPVCKKK